MKALDTNVLVRYYVQDEPRQAATAARIMNDRGYARRAAKLGLKPPVRIPAT